MCRGLEIASSEHGQTKLIISQDQCDHCGNPGAESLEFIIEPAEAIDIAMGLFNTAAPHMLAGKADK